ncbi:hypothetical protein LCGC14_0264240 [marine sediment metagenome]|uniref:Uncharacterized protein n=1 Tax=marine sediment metagenome TaxID=412755 RepID=A0A0F9U0W9_9ZZZZ
MKGQCDLLCRDYCEHELGDKEKQMVEITPTERTSASSQLRIESRTTVKELVDALNSVPQSWNLRNIVGYDEMPVFLRFHEPVGGA